MGNTRRIHEFTETGFQDDQLEVSLSHCSLRALIYLCVVGVPVALSVSTCQAAADKSEARCSLTLIPPSPVTDKIELDIRGAVWNRTGTDQKYQVAVYLDKEQPDTRLYEGTLHVAAGAAQGLQFRWPTTDHAGKHQVILAARAGEQVYRSVRPLEVLARPERTTGAIEGAWFEFYHWSEAEGRLWNKDIVTLTDEQWKELIAGMHEINFNLVIIQDTYHNSNRHNRKHNMDKDGFPGRAYYPSRLYRKNEKIAADDPLEAVLAEADKHGMNVMVGVGCYAWFDFTQGSLDWHKQVADELWNIYGHHPSFYGWYVSDEMPGALGADDQHRDEIVTFFKEFKEHVTQLAPDKPVMLATSSIGIQESNNYYPRLLEHLDIICPFGFHRMPAGDYTGEEAAIILQHYCDLAKAHLWMDMEVFLFGQGSALYPRPISGIISDLDRFKNFEKILCYSYTGLMNSPKQSRQPGGPATVALYKNYQRYLQQGPDAFSLRVKHDALGDQVQLDPAPDQRYRTGNTTNGLLGGTDYLCPQWLGFHNTDLVITLTLAKPTLVKNLAVNCLQFATGGIVLPQEVTFGLSEDGTTYRSLGQVACETPAQMDGVYCRLFQKDGLDESARYVRIQLKSAGEWLFVDEIMVNSIADQKEN